MNLSAKNFDLGNARACCRGAADAYRTRTIVNAETDTNVLIGEAKDCILVAFRGSASIRNWITDAEFARSSLIEGPAGTDCQVHRGFEAALNSVLVDLIRALGGNPSVLVDLIRALGGNPIFKVQPAKPLFLTGHSLGGALAVLAALELSKYGFQVLQVYTFGQPRVGNGDFRARYDAILGDRTFRMVYQEDIVPRFPHLPALHDPYRHVGTEVFVSSITPAKVVEDFWFDPPWWRVLMSDAWGLYRAWCLKKFVGALDPALDHHIANYQLALDAIVDPKPIVESQGMPGTLPARTKFDALP